MLAGGDPPSPRLRRTGKPRLYKIIPLGFRGCPTTLLMLAFVILSETKNLMDPGTYTLEILRLAPQNDVVGQVVQGDFFGRHGGRPYFLILVFLVVKYNG